MLDRVQQDQGEISSQGFVLNRFEESVGFLKSHKDEVVYKVVTCLIHRVKVQHSGLLSQTLALLATQGWEKLGNADLALKAIDSLTPHFELPLERAGYIPVK